MRPVTWQTADDDGTDSPPRSPTRETRPATSRKRRTWYGMGTLTRVEKSGFGRFLHDLTYAYADVTVFSLPVLLYVWQTYPGSALEPTAPGLTAWMVMAVVATLLRGGWIAPVRSGTLGWVSTRRSLLALRLVYYNLVLAVAVYGSLALAVATGVPGVAVLGAVGVATVATLAFPTVADALYHRL